MPQRGKLFVKIWLRAECRPEWRPSKNGELAEIASSSGITTRSRSQTRIARSAPRTPTCTCTLKVLFRQATYWSRVLNAAVVLGVDDLLLLPRAPRVRAGRTEQRVVTGRQREQAGARLALLGHRVGERFPAPGADLDLGLDQLAGHGLGEDRVVLSRGAQLLEALVERERSRIENRELLLEPDREVC